MSWEGDTTGHTVFTVSRHLMHWYSRGAFAPQNNGVNKRKLTSPRLGNWCGACCCIWSARHLKDVYIITGSLMEPLLCLYDLLAFHCQISLLDATEHTMLCRKYTPIKCSCALSPLQKQTTKNDCGWNISQKTFWVTQKLSSASLCGTP